MHKTARRDFLAGTIGGSVLAGVSVPGFQEDLGGSIGSQPNSRQISDRFFTRRVEEMTSREVEFYLKEGGDLVFVPFGPVSGHGAFIPLGMHAHWATALSLLLARKADGLVFPTTYTCFAGATRSFRGTVSFAIEEQVTALKRIALALHKAGFRRVVLVGGTTPENTGGMMAARELFDETERPFYFVECEKLLSAPQVRAIYDGYPGASHETQLCLAALKILGKERPIPAANWAKEIESKGNDRGDQPDEIVGDIQAMRKWGAVGFRYYEEGNHGNHGTAGLIYKGRSDVDMAVEMLEACADVLLPVLQNLAHYANWLDKHPFQYIRATERLNEM
jgi:creatinine amidohydrolase/Fe(II)-dependent formamide hydrolase-like protein